jgi:hypothetical protein
MKHLKRFNEAFIIPKIFRKFIPTWEDEDVALKLLDELKKLPATEEVVEQLMLRLTVPNTFQFKMGEYRFDRGPSLFTLPQFVEELFSN